MQHERSPDNFLFDILTLREFNIAAGPCRNRTSLRNVFATSFTPEIPHIVALYFTFPGHGYIMQFIQSCSYSYFHLHASPLIWSCWWLLQPYLSSHESLDALDLLYFVSHTSIVLIYCSLTLAATILFSLFVHLSPFQVTSEISGLSKHVRCVWVTGRNVDPWSTSTSWKSRTNCHSTSVWHLAAGVGTTSGTLQGNAGAAGGGPETDHARQHNHPKPPSKDCRVRGVDPKAKDHDQQPEQNYFWSKRASEKAVSVVAGNTSPPGFG